MINFETPQHIGFAVSRGTACRIDSDNGVIDYSGHLLNLTARLLEIAQPNGVVIDSAFGLHLLPEGLATGSQTTLYSFGASPRKSLTEFTFFATSSKWKHGFTSHFEKTGRQ